MKRIVRGPGYGLAPCVVHTDRLPVPVNTSWINGSDKYVFAGSKSQYGAAGFGTDTEETEGFS